jgi:hypothetical protein
MGRHVGNRAELEKHIPAMLLHEGTWEGTYRFVDLEGTVTDQYASRIECAFPDDGPWVYVQKNHYAWPDGRVFDTEFGGELRGDRIWWDTDRFQGYGWATHDDIVLLTLDRKDNPGESFSESYSSELSATNAACSDSITRCRRPQSLCQHSGRASGA